MDGKLWEKNLTKSACVIGDDMTTYEYDSQGRGSGKITVLIGENLFLDIFKLYNWKR